MGQCNSSKNSKVNRNSRGLRNDRPYAAYSYDFEQDILNAAIYLENFSNLKDCINLLKKYLEAKVEFKEPLIKAMLVRLGEIDPAIIVDKISQKSMFRIETLISCTESALAALGVLDRTEDGVKWYAKELQRINELFLGYIDKKSPLAWERLFAGSFNLAIFLKYASFEDLNLAYEQIVASNMITNSGESYLNDKLAQLLENTKKLYSSPIITRYQVSTIMKDASPTANAYYDILSQLEEKGNSQDSEESRLIHRLSVAWIKHFNKDSEIKFPVPPRNVQIINMLNISEWIYRTITKLNSNSWTDTLMKFVFHNNDGRCLITQVGTGEGKRFLLYLL